MAGMTRSSQRKQPLRSQPSSSAATVEDALMHSGNGTRGHGDMSRLSQDLEPMKIDNGGQNVGEAEALGEHLKEAIAVINKLQGLGLSRMSIPLPKCIVLGEQSTGKSSVIEGISGIKTPRSTDTCTRCPLYIQLEPSNDPNASWNARICLRFTYAYDGKRRKTFPGWCQASEVFDTAFASTNSPLELEDLIARAQLAVLSPETHHSEFLAHNGLSRAPQHLFSPNVVLIYVSQPGLPALSFYDLPGIIGQAETEDQNHLVKFVTDLVSTYINDPESLVLVACSLENDIANSHASQLARELKATKRCIGVLTKPDRLPAGSREDKLQEVLSGSRYPLGHGYYVCKNPSQVAINQGLSHKNARMQEQDFFATHAPWSTTFQEYQSRFGTANLQKNLSRLLTYRIEEQLPVIMKQVQERLAHVDLELQKYPEPPTHNATRMINDILTLFSRQIGEEMLGEYPHRTWDIAWKALRDNFLTELMSKKPTMKVVGSLDHGIFASDSLGKSKDTSILLDSDDEDDEDVAMTQSPDTPSKKRKIEDGFSTPVRRQAIDAVSRLHTPSRCDNTSAPSTPIKPEINEDRMSFQLDKIAAYLRDSSRSTVPSQIDPKITDHLILDTIQHWHQPTHQFFNKLREELVKTVRIIFEKHFGPWKASTLHSSAWSIVEDLLNTHLHEQRNLMAVDSLKDEEMGPFVYDDEDFEELRLKTRDHYRSHRTDARINRYALELQCRPFSDDEKARFLKDALKRALVEQEPYEREVDVVTRVVTYYVFAAKRLRSSICARISSKLLKPLAVMLKAELESRLGIDDAQNGLQNAQQLLAESNLRTKQRHELLSRKTALLNGLEHLKTLQDPDANGGLSNSFGYSSSFGPTSTPLTQEMVDITRSGLARR